MNARQRMNEQILTHGENLKTIFNLTGDAVKIAKQVHSLEVKAAKVALDYCNGDIEMEGKEYLEEKLLSQLDKVLNFSAQAIPVFFNGDPRGYTLKIDDKYVRDNNLAIYLDWGGYGILAPEFDGKR
jgi:hypothetical protein